MDSLLGLSATLGDYSKSGKNTEVLIEASGGKPKGLDFGECRA